MFISADGIRLIKYFEGFRSVKYICQGGFYTIGYGHKIKTQEHLEEVTLKEAELILDKDLQVICKQINRMTGIKLLQNQYDAIVSFVFNVGLRAYQRSTLRAKVNRGEHDQVPAEFMKWVYVGTIKSNGLIKRRNTEGMLYLNST